TGAAATANVGSYAIGADLSDGGTGKLANYTVTINPGMLTVDPAPLMVTVDDASKVYGTHNPVFAAHYSGFLLGQSPVTLSGTLPFSTPAPAASHVGDSSVAAGGLSSTNYLIGYVAGTLSVTPALLTVTADDQTKVYGATLPPLTAS